MTGGLSTVTTSEPPSEGVTSPWMMTGARPPLFVPHVTVELVCTSSAVPVAPVLVHAAVPPLPEMNWLAEVTV